MIALQKGYAEIRPNWLKVEKPDFD